MKCTDKLKMKLYLKEKGIPMTPFLGKKMYQGSDKAVEELGDKLIVKPRKNSGGRGLKVITDKSEIDKALNNRTLLEKSIEGSEGSVETLIEDGLIKFTNITQYKDLGICNYVPCHYSEEKQENILALNQSVISALRIKWGITHLEFYDTSKGLLFGEVALRPPGGYIMEAMEQAYGCNFWDLLVCVELGLEIKIFPKQIRFAASRIIYPSLGTITEIDGEEDSRNLASVRKLSLKAKVSQEVQKRSGVGEDLGYCIFANEDKQQLIADIESFKKILMIKTIPSSD
jgi:biotin carboxylase